MISPTKKAPEYRIRVKLLHWEQEYNKPKAGFKKVASIYKSLMRPIDVRDLCLTKKVFFGSSNHRLQQ